MTEPTPPPLAPEPDSTPLPDPIRDDYVGEGGDGTEKETLPA